ncbi:MAG: GTPase [Candidatus Hecatellales archaeon]|nr:MAG: GTPase [Candidatus Hecatellales archaeon]
MTVQIVFMGTAGSGKTSLVAAFSRWLSRELGATVACVNLDPGCERLPYQPSLDIRRWFTLRQVMEEEGLGPNGALVGAVERLLSLGEELFGRLEGLEADYVLLDTPGQAEVFLFREAGFQLASTLKRLKPTVGVYLVDLSLARRGVVGLAASLLLGLASQLWVGLEGFLAFNKADLKVDVNLEEILLNPQAFKERLLREAGVSADLSASYLEVFSRFARAQRPVKVSALTGEGLKELYDAVHETLCECGDLT